MSDASRIPDPAALLREAMAGDAEPRPWTAPDAAALAAAFPELAIHELAGQGGMAAVYRATQVRLGRQVALKVMRQDLAAQPQFAERFVREAKALAALANPHVLAIHDFGERAGFCYLVTEYVDGANLRELMRLGQLSPAEVLRIVPQICAGLHFAHQHGVVHRDIKPENVLVDRQGQVKLADFGLAKLVGDGGAALTQSQSVFGTPHYMAPEQWRGAGAVDHRADIYSLGVVLYELLTGRLPVGTYAPASQQPGVPKGIDEVVQRSLQQEPDRRYQSARDVQRDLEQQVRPSAAAAQPTQAAAPASAAAAPVASTRSVGGWLLAALAVLLAGAFGIVLVAAARADGNNAAMAQREQLLRYERACQELQGRLAAGMTWTAPLPTYQPGPGAGALPQATGVAVILFLMVVVYGLFLAFARVARARAADAAVPRWQYTLAGFCVWSPAWLAVAIPLGMLAEHYADASRGFVPVLVVVLGLGLLLLLGRWLHQEGASRVAVETPKPGRLFWVGVALLVSMACGLPLLVRGGAVEVPSVRFPLVPAAELVGLSRAALLDRCGPPTGARATAAVTTLQFAGVVTDQAGGVRPASQLVDVELRGNVVEAVAGEATWLLRALEPAKTPYLGQTRDEIVRALGSPVEMLPGVEGATLVRFSPQLAVLFSADGIAVHIQR